jgi:hypothetical protein
MMSYRSRSLKSHSVTDSLRASRGHTSDQGEVWAEIQRMHAEAGTASLTHAMRDVYAAKTPQLDEYEHAFACAPQQRGSLFFINGQVVGFDVISQEAAYQQIHSQLVKSYALDALLLESSTSADGVSLNKVEAFLQEAMNGQESRFEGVSQGYDYRFQGPKVVGSALVYEESVIHMAFFRAAEAEQDQRMAGFMQRRLFRRNSRS